jgi:hypothetical protein
MANANSRVTIHIVASLDGFIARRDGSVDWLETSDEFVDAIEWRFTLCSLLDVDESAKPLPR